MNETSMEVIAFACTAIGSGLLGWIFGRVQGRREGWSDVIEDRVRYYENAGFIHVDDQMGGQW